MTEKLQEGCTVQPQTKEELAKIIYDTCQEKGWDCDLNFIDTSKITDMSYLFADPDNIENCPDIAFILNINMNITKFDLSPFNGDISKWDTSNVTNMSRMFCYAYSFNQPLNNWNTSNVEDMRGMFAYAKSFNHPLDNWNVLNVEDMSGMFEYAKSFNHTLDNWDVSNVKTMASMFDGATSFNQPLDTWNTSNVKDMSYMFAYAESFNQPLNNWDVSNVKNMQRMFCGAESFNQPLNNWNTSNVKRMSNMFSYARSFNQPLDTWDTSNVKYMEGMFAYTDFFNQPLDKWNVSNVRDMEGMFSLANSFKSELPDFKNYKGTKEELLEELDLPPDYKSEIKKNQESYIVQPQTTEELAEIICKICQEKGWNCDLNFTDANQATTEKIKVGLKLVQENKNNKVNHTDCDWIFNDIKDMIEDAVKNKVSLSDIVKCIATSGSYTNNGRKLKVTTAKLAVWLKANGIARTVHKRKSRKIKKETM